MLKCIDLFNLLFALLAFVIQVITMHTNENAINVRIVFSINCIIFYIRIMKLYTANSSLGPKLEMIKMMVSQSLQCFDKFSKFPNNKAECFFFFQFLLKYVIFCIYLYSYFKMIHVYIRRQMFLF